MQFALESYLIPMELIANPAMEGFGQGPISKLIGKVIDGFLWALNKLKTVALGFISKFTKKKPQPQSKTSAKQNAINVCEHVVNRTNSAATSFFNELASTADTIFYHNMSSDKLNQVFSSLKRVIDSDAMKNLETYVQQFEKLPSDERMIFDTTKETAIKTASQLSNDAAAMYDKIEKFYKTDMQSDSKPRELDKTDMQNINQLPKLTNCVNKFTALITRYLSCLADTKIVSFEEYQRG